MTTKADYLDKLNITKKLNSISNGNEFCTSGVAAKRHVMLDNILAVAHRDGGHYTVNHGYSKSCSDAIKVISSNQNRVDEARSLALRALSLMEEDMMPYNAIEELIKCLK